MSHTPGPWTCEEGEVLGGDGDVFIAEIVGRGRPCAVENPNEVEANARLMAAAPDLLAAGRKMRAAMSRLALSIVLGHPVGKDIEEAVNDAQDAMIAAIAKAEGQP
jgi:hypothetical protein